MFNEIGEVIKLPQVEVEDGVLNVMPRMFIAIGWKHVMTGLVESAPEERLELEIRASVSTLFTQTSWNAQDHRMLPCHRRKVIELGIWVILVRQKLTYERPLLRPRMWRSSSDQTTRKSSYLLVVPFFVVSVPCGRLNPQVRWNRGRRMIAEKSRCSRCSL